MPARWAPGPKDGVGTALSSASNVWFTIGHGILNEVFYPQVDTPSVRDFGLIVTDGHQYFSEESASVDSEVAWGSRGVPAFRVTNRSRDGRYLIRKRIVSDPDRPVVLQRISFQSVQGGDYRLYALLAPHMGDRGGDNTAWVEERNGTPLLLAERDGCVLALAASVPFLQWSVGFVGISDGWQDLHAHGDMTWHYERADGGNCALTAEVDGIGREVTLALGFGRTADAAITNTLESLAQPFKAVQSRYTAGWKQWLDGLDASATGVPAAMPVLVHKSLATLKVHESKNPGGGLVAGLATPWGYASGDDAKIGYHVVWTRDMVESAGGLIAAGAREGAARMLRLLKNTQQSDGHWPQNMWVDGTPYWGGIQMDETALPIVLVNIARREGALPHDAANEFWPMVRAAASYILCNGPVTQQDRWEEDPGYTPFTVAAEIAALLIAADFAEEAGESEAAKFMRETADGWYDQIDAWLYVTGTDWCAEFGVSGYYERIASVSNDAVSRFQNVVQVKNVPGSDACQSAVHLISPDALALVRFGLRKADDPRIVNTVKVVDALLRIETPVGTTWRRYNDDGYGEHADGSAFDGTGIGRGWPLLTGERAHYELALGRLNAAKRLKVDMEHFAGRGGLLPEQVWDREPIPEHELAFGRPTGSAMPLAWAHGEYLKLFRSLRDGRIFDQPLQTVKRYLEHKSSASIKSWRFNHKIRTISPHLQLRIEALAPATVHWTKDNWKTVRDDPTRDTNLGVHFADLDTRGCASGTKIEFTFYWHHTDTWEGQNFSVEVQ